MDPKIVQELKPRNGSSVGRLTPRQFDVLQLIAQGHNNGAIANGAIAEALIVSEKSVENHINSIFHELEILRTGPAHPRVVPVLKHLEETKER